MKQNFFQQNRKNITRDTSGGIIVLSAYTKLQRSNDAAFAFEQEANFWYLTGIEHPDWRLVVDGTSGAEWLIAPEIDTVHQLFDGSLSNKRAADISGVKNVVSHEDGQKLLRDLAKRHSMAYTIELPEYANHFDFVCNPAITENKRLLERTFKSVRSCQKELLALRAIKQPEEILAIKKAITLTMSGFEFVKEKFDSYSYEYEIEADFSHHFTYRAAASHAYDPIVASAKNACTLHYTANNQKLAKNQLILMDIGARCQGYAADITRTYAYGTLSKRQAQMHNALQQAQQQIIALITPSLSLQEYSNEVDRIMKRTLQALGLIKTMDDHDSYRKYFPHAVSHGLGIDVHDSFGGYRNLEPGMVLTVEPGIYIPEEKIGIRIEDDILVTDKGHKNLSAALSTSW